MELSSFLSFFAASVALTLLPGPDLLYVISQSMSKGAKTGFYIALGLVSGLIFHTGLAATGLTLIIYKSTTAIKIVQYAGATYLFYLAYKAYNNKQTELVIAKNKVETPSFIQLWKTGVLMNVLNPKVSLFFIAFFPQFIQPNSSIKISWQILILGLIFMLQAICIFAIASVIAGKFYKLLSNERFKTLSRWTNVFILIVLAIGLLFS